MDLNVFCGCLVLALFSTFVNEVRTQGMSLGSLQWCDTLCLCNDDTKDRLHCFQEQEIYSLMDVDARQMFRLKSANFHLQEKLTWCNETCLCHKDGEKTFKCSDSVKLGEFMETKAPFLVQYLELRIEEEKKKEEEEEEEVKKEKKDRHERKRNRKHRRNRKKNQPEHVTTELPEPSAPEPLTTPAPSMLETTTEPEKRVLHAHIFSHADPGVVETQSRIPSPEPVSTVVGVSKELNEVEFEVIAEVMQLKESGDQLIRDLTLNRHILWATILLAGIANLGVLFLSIYLCCVRRRSKTLTKGQRNSSHHQDGNNMTKVHLDEAW